MSQQPPTVQVTLTQEQLDRIRSRRPLAANYLQVGQAIEIRSGKARTCFYFPGLAVPEDEACRAEFDRQDITDVLAIVLDN